MKYLIVGLGNIGPEYHNTRHNIGFTVLDAMADKANIFFADNRYGATCEIKLKGHNLILLKPSTFMNLSGNALRYWMQKENIPIEQVLVIVDDLALPPLASRAALTLITVNTTRQTIAKIIKIIIQIGTATTTFCVE